MREAGEAAPPQALARAGGALYLGIIALGLFGQVGVRDRIVVWGDPGATAANLRSMESLWRAGVAAEILLLTCALALVPIFYVLLRPVSRLLALMAVGFDLVSVAVEAVSALFLHVALFPLSGASSLGGFEPEQLHVLASLSIRSHAHGFGFGLIYFGWFCIVAGYLIHRSGYLPRALGVMMAIAGLSYLANSFALILAPALAARLFPAVLMPALVGELSLCLWLLVRGVDVNRWRARAGPH